MKSTFKFCKCFKIDIITLYFDCILAITSNVLTNILMQHMVLVSPNFEFFKNEKNSQCKTSICIETHKIGGFYNIKIIFNNSF
jgi:hypothetical protein